MPQGMSVPQIIWLGLMAIVYILVAAGMLRHIIAPVRTVKARVAGKNRVESVLKTKAGGKHTRYVVIFETEGKRLSFYVSEFSWNGYHVGERGQLTYKGGRLLDFA